MHILILFFPSLGLSTIRNRQNSEESYDFVVGDRVLVSGHRKGTIRFAGETEFATGKADMFCLSFSFEFNYIYQLRFTKIAGRAHIFKHCNFPILENPSFLKVSFLFNFIF